MDVRMTGEIGAGDRLPHAHVGKLVDGELRVDLLSDVLSGERAVIVGVPGAYTPVCSRVHLPGFVTKAPELLAAGFDRIVCLSADNPWVLEHWAAEVDPGGWIDFRSDGNLEFGRGAGLLTREPDLLLSACLRRFTMVVNRSLVERVSVERSVLTVSCSAAGSLTAEAA